MNIGNNIRNFRRGKDMTQEELAELLNVTVSAISQWESSKTMPDITLLPKLAIIFGVSTDELLGFSVEQNNEYFNYFKEKIDSLYVERKYDEMVTLARKAMQELPNNYDVMYLLAFSLDCIENTPSILDEKIELLESIFNKCADTKMRLRATNMLCYAYSAKGNKQKALYYTEQLPHAMQFNQIRMKMHLDLIPQNELLEAYRYQIDSLYSLMSEYILNIADADYKNPYQKASFEKRIEIIKNLISICKSIYGENPCDKNFDLYNYYRIIGALYLYKEDDEKAIDNLEIACQYALNFDESFNNGDMYSSPIMNEIESCDKRVWSITPCKDMLKRLTTQERYIHLSSNSRFTKIIERLKTKA
ncbi:MAG: helix-turn-helix transcriptional regulator [Clostridia bacterium]|nr:helix-turn-helix transcriptional regulator [Clostridia bacterium]